jgi:hypothetical protein
MQTGSSGTLIGWKSGQTTFVPLMGTNGGSVATDSELTEMELANYPMDGKCHEVDFSDGRKVK